MSRSCTVCAHPRRDAIERAVIDGQSNSAIADSFAVGRHAVIRHAERHLPQSLADTVAVLAPAVQSLQSNSAIAHTSSNLDIMGQVERHMGRINKLSDAADRWLTDPENADCYDIGPRSNEITVVYDDYNDTNRNGRPRRKRDSLHALLARCENANIHVESAEARYADPRDVILKSADGARGHLTLLVTVLDKLHGAEQAKRFEEAVLEAIGEVAPDVRQRIEESLHHSSALRLLIGRDSGR